MAPRPNRSISLPITLSSVAIALSIALLVGWTYLIVTNPVLAQDIVANRLLLWTGIFGFVVITTVLLLFSVFLVREIREVRRQTSFIDSVTHELKSPLAALKLCLETLAREGLPEAQRERLRGMMLDDVDRLTAFIDRVLAATRLGQDRGAQEIETVQLVELVRKVVAVVTRRAKIDEGAVRIEIPGDLTMVTDAVALATVLENLIDNAIKYSDPPPDIRVSARPADARWLIIEVADRGIGIPRGQDKRIFDRFYRIPSEAVRARRGTGLGLYVVSELVRLLGGQIEARSAGPGRGTTMVVTLPGRRI
ncbi:MAG: HAMP domain-containing histidine kinase [Myxococcales bacterium]|nr:HAMP domain-containing histidine kinase [Myxococcales bacterium]MCB9566980.1 HAMP domain-containing histidine kinase [Myxococcales bacterium]MCB9704716.1 HAMP domain-containing histidine kinase [Myxococcales bacterium]